MADNPRLEAGRAAFLAGHLGERTEERVRLAGDPAHRRVNRCCIAAPRRWRVAAGDGARAVGGAGEPDLRPRWGGRRSPCRGAGLFP